MFILIGITSYTQAFRFQNYRQLIKMVNVIKLIKYCWQQYIDWCDRMGLTPDNRRSCMPRLADPELIKQTKLIADKPESTQR